MEFILNEAKEVNRDFFYFRDSIWAIAEGNLFRKNKNDWSVICKIPKGYEEGLRNHFSIRCYKDKILIFYESPAKAAVYSETTHGIDEIVFSDDNGQTISDERTRYTIRQQDEFFVFVPMTGCNIIHFDIITYKYTVYSNWKRYLVNYFGDIGRELNRIHYEDACIYEGNIYLSLQSDQGDYIAALNMDSMEVQEVYEHPMNNNNHGLYLTDKMLFFQNMINGNFIYAYDIATRCMIKKFDLSEGKERVFFRGFNNLIGLFTSSGSVYVLEDYETLYDKNVKTDKIYYLESFSEKGVIILEDESPEVFDVTNNEVYRFDFLSDLELFFKRI